MAWGSSNKSRYSFLRFIDFWRLKFKRAWYPRRVWSQNFLVLVLHLLAFAELVQFYITSLNNSISTWTRIINTHLVLIYIWRFIDIKYRPGTKPGMRERKREREKLLLLFSSYRGFSLHISSSFNPNDSKVPHK